MTKRLSGIVLLLIAVGGCELLNGRHSGAASSPSIEVVNRTGNELFLLVFTAETLSLVRIAHVVSIDPGDSGLVASNASTTLPLKRIAEDLGADDKVAFLLYSPVQQGAAENSASTEAEGGSQFHLARTLLLDLRALEEMAFRVVISTGDLVHPTIEHWL